MGQPARRIAMGGGQPCPTTNSAVTNATRNSVASAGRSRDHARSPRRNARNSRIGAANSAGPAKKRAREYAFAVDANDHCETPGEAYEDVVPFLRQLAAQLGKEPRELAIYDPYYCNGAVVAHLGARGFPRDDYRH